MKAYAFKINKYIKITSHAVVKHWLALQTPTILLAVGIRESECIMQISSVVIAVSQREYRVNTFLSKVHNTKSGDYTCFINFQIVATG